MFDTRLDENNPANYANAELNKIPGIFKKYYQPYMEQGQQVDPQLMEQYAKMFGNPSEFFNQLGQGYQQSPGYQYALQQALGASGNAAAAGGLLGTPMHQEQNMQAAQGLASQDYQKYIENLMSTLGLGAQGLGEFSKRGFEAGTGLGSGLANVQGQKAQYAYGGKAAENAAKEARRNSMIAGIGGIAGGLGSLFL